MGIAAGEYSGSPICHKTEIGPAIPRHERTGDPATDGPRAKTLDRGRRVEAGQAAGGGVTLTTYQKWKRKWHALPVIVAKCQIAWK